eukprot:351805-Chlamydomonas_euryale.AAC.5
MTSSKNQGRPFTTVGVFTRALLLTFITLQCHVLSAEPRWYSHAHHPCACTDALSVVRFITKCCVQGALPPRPPADMCHIRCEVPPARQPDLAPSCTGAKQPPIQKQRLVTKAVDTPCQPNPLSLQHEPLTPSSHAVGQVLSGKHEPFKLELEFSSLPALCLELFQDAGKLCYVYRIGEEVRGSRRQSPAMSTHCAS